MLAFDPDPSIRWLFCMTHPDDEISICAWIKRLTSAGVEVWISWTHDTPRRRAEAESAADALGVPLTRLFFHGGTDGFVCSEMNRLMPSFEAMMAKCRPHRVACGAFEQGHLDHDATNCLVQATFDGPVFEIPFYYSYLTRLPRVNRFADPSREEVIQLDKSEARFKLDYAKGFPSQRIFTNMIFANLRAKLTGDGSLTRTERMRLQTWTEFRQPQHKSPLASRIRDCDNWKYWVECVRDFESRRLSG